MSDLQRLEKYFPNGLLIGERTHKNYKVINTVRIPMEKTNKLYEESDKFYALPFVISGILMGFILSMLLITALR